MIRASVAMVTYNGENYVEEQIASILESMGEQDELVISDDGSTDGTPGTLMKYKETDSRVRIVRGPGRGVKANVDFCIRECQGKYIFLADQDDIWNKQKIERMIDTFVKNGCSVVVHDATVVKEDGKSVLRESFYEIKHSGAGALKNIWRNTYVGCCMAFRRELIEYVLPIPETIEMHDQWIGVVNDVRGRGTCFIKDKLISYRRHGDNNSSMKHYGIRRMIQNRLAFVRVLMTNWRHIHEGGNY